MRVPPADAAPHHHEDEVGHRAGDRDRTPFLVAIALGLAPLSLVAGCSADPPPGQAGRPAVAVVGDSLVSQSTSAIDTELGGHGYTSMVTGRSGAHIEQMAPQLVRAAGPGTDAEVVVAALGTNNAFYASVDDDRHRPLDLSERELDAAMRDVLDGPGGGAHPTTARCLVWVNTNDHTPVPGMPDNAARLNAAIEARAESHRARGQEVVVVDFATASRDRPEWFLADGLHLTEVGQAAYARLIRQGVDDCEA